MEWKNKIDEEFTEGPPMKLQDLSDQVLFIHGLNLTSMSREWTVLFLSWLLNPTNGDSALGQELQEWRQRLQELTQEYIRHRYPNVSELILLNSFSSRHPQKGTWRRGSRIYGHSYLHAVDDPDDLFWGGGDLVAQLRVPISRIIGHSRIHQQYGATSEQEFILSEGPLDILDIGPNGYLMRYETPIDPRLPPAPLQHADPGSTRALLCAG